MGEDNVLPPRAHGGLLDEELRRRLLVRHRVLVRDCASFGLPDHIRVCARPAPDLDRLVSALGEEVLA